MQKISDSAVIVGSLRVKGGGRAPFALQGTVARTDTVAKNLFKLPKGALLVSIHVGGTVASNAGTTAIVDVGKTGTDNFFVAAADVKTAGLGDANNAKATKNGGAQGEIQVTGKYSETGAASNTGGPWTVTVVFLK